MDPERNKFIVDWLPGNKIADSVVDFVLIGFGLIAGIAGWFLDNQEYTWFSRSGSVMVLIGAILEFRHNRTSLGAIQESIRWASGVGQPSIFELAWHQKAIKFSAHVFVIVGTLIWGFGDVYEVLLEIF